MTALDRLTPQSDAAETPRAPVARCGDPALGWIQADDLAHEAAACRRLWAAVALVALSDAKLDLFGPAGRWVFTDDGANVLSLAGLDADAAQERVCRLITDRRATLLRAIHDRATIVATWEACP